MGMSREQRLEICLSCDKLTLETRTCTECDCNIDVKVIHPEGACPIGKWGTSDFEGPSPTWMIAQRNEQTSEPGE
jgi:hypothetical protein